MQRGKLNMVVDGQWGSCGKGLIAGYLASRYEVNIASTNNLPNAGHTIITDDGNKFISKVIPASAILNKVRPMKIFIGPGAGFFLNRLFEEIEDCRLDSNNLVIHPRAMVVTEYHAALERGERAEQGTKHIASTMQGSGAARSERLMRGSGVKLARDFPELSGYIASDWINEVHEHLSNNMWLHEGSQGFSLGLLHGSHYPQCTSRECTTTRELSDLGVAPQMLGDVYLVIRPYPIRVGNVVENGQQLGYSGDCYSDHHEIDWKTVQKSAGYPENTILQEYTTVTKRLRRVFTFSLEQVKKAALINGATKIALNFANYLDYSCYGTQGNSKGDLPPKIRGFIDALEQNLNIPVALVGTGPANNHVWELNNES